MKFLKTLPVLAGAAVLLSACADKQPLDPRAEIAEVDAPTFNRQHAPGLQRVKGLDAEFVQVAQEVPGFGGMFYDEAGNLNVYMTRGHIQAAQESELKANLARSIRARGRDVSTAHQMIIREGEFDFLQLAGWSERALPVLSVPGVVFTDIDESQNKLVVGIESGTSLTHVEAALKMLDIPGEVVAFEITEPIVPLSEHTLRNQQKPVGGGLQIVFERPGVGWFVCTLGFNIMRDEPARSTPYFITNSHCGAERGVVTGTRYYHHSPFVEDPSKTFIGTEVVDPPHFTSPCFTGWVCRWSDAAIVQYDRRVPVNFGSIYRTKSFGTTTPGSLEIEDSESKFFTIRGEEPYALGGETLNKVGRTTGWTRGPVTRTCVNVGAAGTNIAMLCQDYVAAAVAGGDSGSPVFRQDGDSKDVTLYGILWGGGGSNFVFSPLENIREDLGDFRTH